MFLKIYMPYIPLWSDIMYNSFVIEPNTKSQSKAYVEHWFGKVKNDILQ